MVPHWEIRRQNPENLRNHTKSTKTAAVMCREWLSWYNSQWYVRRRWHMCQWHQYGNFCGHYPALSCCAGWQNGFLEADWSFARDAYSTCIYSTGCTFPKFPKFEHYGFAFGYGDDPNILIGNLFVHERFWPTAYSFVYCGSWDSFQNCSSFDWCIVLNDFSFLVSTQPKPSNWGSVVDWISLNGTRMYKACYIAYYIILCSTCLVVHFSKHGMDECWGCWSNFSMTASKRFGACIQ